MDKQKRIALMKAFQDKLNEYQKTGDVSIMQDAYHNWKEFSTYMQESKRA